MAYKKHVFKSGDVLYAEQLNEMDEQLAKDDERIAASVTILEGPPTKDTEGSVGCVRVDKSTGKLYRCDGASGGTYSWVCISTEYPNGEEMLF